MHLHDLPIEVRKTMLYYAHPKINDDLQRAIEVTAAHHCLKRIQRIWTNRTPFVSIHHENMIPSICWEEMLYLYLPIERQLELIDHLKKCGCCTRHSKGVFTKPHCTHIVGSHTFHSRHLKYTWGHKKCTCWCRSQIRHFQSIHSMNIN